MTHLRHDYPDIPLVPPQDAPERPLWPDRGRDWGDAIALPIAALMLLFVVSMLTGCGGEDVSQRIIKDHEPPQIKTWKEQRSVA
jgi:hypothetical protein